MEAITDPTDETAQLSLWLKELFRYVMQFATFMLFFSPINVMNLDGQYTVFFKPSL